MNIKNKINNRILNDILSIEPKFLPFSNYNSNNLDFYIKSMQLLLGSIIPKDVLEEMTSPSLDEVKKAFLKMNQNIPIISSCNLEDKSNICFSFCVFCFSDLTYGINRFITDMINRWLLPGKFVVINGQRSIQFKFKNFTNKNYFLSEYFINISCEKELFLIRNNLDNFKKEMKLIILSVEQTRQISSINKISNEQKSSLIEKNLSSLLKNKSNTCTFGQMENLLFKISEEKKLNEIKENLSFLMNKRPQIFDRDIFDSLHYNSLLFKKTFTKNRSPNHVSKIIASFYYLKKNIKELSKSSKKKHINIKVFKTTLPNLNKSVLGVLMVMNLLKENEVFEKGYILEAISHIVKDIKYVKESYILDHRTDKLLSFYLEIEKSSDVNFSLTDIRNLKKKLPDEFKEKIKALINPIFIPRNEEEILRNIVILTKQLKYVKDLPQVIISYEKQINKDIVFNVILLRVLTKDSLSLNSIFSNAKTFLKINLEETKIVGKLRNKFPKESNIFKVSLKKHTFLRRDYSLDLRKARHTLTQELSKIIGEFRDFNGGMISTQLENLVTLKKIFTPLKKSKEFLLENFFYSLRPCIMQNILDSQILKKFFLVFLNIEKTKFDNKNYVILNEIINNNFFVIVKTKNISFLKNIISNISKLKFSSFELTSFSLEKNDYNILGYLLSSIDDIKQTMLLKNIKDTLENKA